MATTLKTTVEINTASSLSTPSKLTKTMTDVIASNEVEFVSANIADSSSLTLYSSDVAAGNGGIMYFYFESNASNTAAVDLSITNGSTNGSAFFARIKPGKNMFVPVWANDANGFAVTATAGANGGIPVNISYFISAIG